MSPSKVKCGARRLPRHTLLSPAALCTLGLVLAACATAVALYVCNGAPAGVLIVAQRALDAPGAALIRWIEDHGGYVRPNLPPRI